MSAQTETITQAYRFALQVTPEQEERLRSYTGAARFAFNWGLALVKERLDRGQRGEDAYVPWSYQGLGGAAERAPRSVQGKTALLKAELGGAAVVPGPGDPDGSAEAEVSARPGVHKICVRMEYELGVGRATAIHVHEAGVGEAGPAVATLCEEAVAARPDRR